MPDAAQFCTSCGAYLTPPVAAAAARPVAAPMVLPPGAAALSGRRYAGFWIRFLACFIDGIILQVASFVLALPIILVLGVAAAGGGRMTEQMASASAMFLLFPLTIVMNWLYEAGFTSSARQATPGKMALNIVVTDMAEGRISFGRASGRHFAKYLSSFTLLIGYLIQPFTEKRQALHDLLAGTLVVRR